MEYIKTKLFGASGQQVMDKIRHFGISQLSVLEMHYPYLRHTLPEQPMTDQEAREQLNKIEKLANWLDNAIPGSPVPIGLDAILVMCI
jgi:hypothetical protein